MEEKELNVNNESVQNAQPEETKCKRKKLSGDLRTFIISLLTAVIVVLAYHGILMAIRCAKKDCARTKKFCMMQMNSCPMQQMPRRMNKGNFHHHHEMRRKVEKCPDCAKREFNNKKSKGFRECVRPHNFEQRKPEQPK